MGVTVAVTRVAANTSTGTQDITTTDLGGLTPKAVLLIATRGVTDGTAADGAGYYVGASDGTNEWTQGYEDQHGQASMNNAEEQDTTANRILTIYNGAASDTVEATANFSSWLTNGVQIDWTDAPASAFLITAIFFAGSDLSTHVGTQTLGNTADALIAVTSVGFEADVVIAYMLEGTTTLNAGVAAGLIHNNRSGTVTQRALAHKQRDTFGSSQVAVQYRDGEGIARLQSTDAVDFHGTFQSFDSSGFDVQLGNTRSPGNTHLGWIALRLGSSPVVSAKVYTYSTPTGTGSHTDSTPGFEPQFVMYLTNRAAAADTSESDADGGVFGILALDADDLYTNTISSEDGAADSNTQSLSDDKLNLPTHTGASGHEATLTSIGSTGPVWNYSATDGTARLWPALAIGVNASSTLLVIQNADSSHTSDNLALTQHNILAINNSDSAHTSENLVLTQHNVLVIQAADSAHTSENLVLTQHNALTIQAADSAHTSENVVLFIAVLVIQDSNHAHTSENVTLTAYLPPGMEGTRSRTTEIIVLLTPARIRR